MNKYSNIIKSTSLFGGVQGLNILLNILRTMAVSRLLGPEGVGLNSIYNETRELLHTTSNLGLDVSGVRGISASYEHQTNAASEEERSIWAKKVSDETTILRSWVLILALFGMMLCMFFAMPLSLLTFDDYDHTWGYVIISPAVAFSTITCGELALLKGLRRLKTLALVSVLNVVLGLVICIPIYYIWRIDGVLPALLSLSFVVMLTTLFFSLRTQKLRLVFSSRELRKGHKMLTVGFNFVVCSIISHSVLLGIMTYLNKTASEQMVGLYNSGYTLTMTYAGLVFAAIETDYFPRLSGVITDMKLRTETLLRQQDVMLILTTPLLIAMLVALPLIVPILLGGRFLPIIPMAQATTVGLLFRAIYLPNAYMSLAAGDNKTFLAINILGSIDILLVILGYHYYGLLGMGVALTVQNLIDMLIVMGISRWRYGVMFSTRRILKIIASILLLALAYASCLLCDGWTYWIIGLALTTASALYSLKNYKRQ